MFQEAERERRLEPGEEERLFKACSPHLRALVTAALETCCRVSELLKLEWKHVRFDQNEIRLPAANTKARRPRIPPDLHRTESAPSSCDATIQADANLAGRPSCLGMPSANLWRRSTPRGGQPAGARVSSGCTSTTCVARRITFTGERGAGALRATVPHHELVDHVAVFEDHAAEHAAGAGYDNSAGLARN